MIDPKAARAAGIVRAALRSAAWWLAVITLGMIALAALANLRALLGPLWSGSTGPWGRAGVLFAAGYVGVALGAMVVAWRLADARRSPPWLPPVLVVGLAVAARVAVAIAFDAPLYGENRIIHEQALGVLDGACCFSHRPMGYPMALAAAYAVFGIGPAAVELLNLGFAVVTAWLVWSIGRAAWGPRVGVLGGVLYALVPSQVLMVLVPLTEPMFTMLVAALVRLAMELRRPAVATAAGIGALVALGQYVRATAVSFLAPLVLLLGMTPGWSLRHVRDGGLLVATFLVLMAPVVAYNLEAHGDLSVSTSAYGGWSLYVGANREHDGQWNAEDAARFAQFPGSSWWDRSEYAGSLVGDRIAEDPEGELRLLPRKFVVMWADERYAAAYGLAAGPPTREVHVAWLVSQLIYAPLVLLAAIGMVLERSSGGRRWRPAALLIGMLVTLVALSHLALEVHSRYHAYVVPLLCVLAAAGLVGLRRPLERLRSGLRSLRSTA